eukprot:6492301-Amphidinium_carterae.9
MRCVLEHDSVAECLCPSGQPLSSRWRDTAEGSSQECRINTWDLDCHRFEPSLISSSPMFRVNCQENANNSKD